METKIPEGMRIQYNFVRPHMALQNRTHAQKAGINVVKEKGNKWMDLLSLAMRSNDNE